MLCKHKYIFTNNLKISANYGLRKYLKQSLMSMFLCQKGAKSKSAFMNINTRLTDQLLYSCSLSGIKPNILLFHFTYTQSINTVQISSKSSYRDRDAA